MRSLQRKTTGALRGWARTCAWALVVAWTAAGVKPAEALGQERGDGWARCRFEPDPGARAPDRSHRARVTGRLVSGDGTPATQTRVSLRPFREERGRTCSVVTGSEGVFEFRDVAVGYYQLTVPDTRLLPTAPIQVRVWEDSVVRIDIPVHARPLLADCLAETSCATVLTTESSSEVEGSDEWKLRLLGYRLAFALAYIGGAWKEAGTAVFCVPDSQNVIDALRQLHPATVPANECTLHELHIPWARGMGARVRFRHDPDGWPAAVAEEPRIQRISDGRARLSVVYTVGRLWAAGHDCDVVREGSSWIVTTCRKTWVS